MADDLIGYLEVRVDGADQHATQDLIDIYGNEPFYLGRNPALCLRHWPDPTISNKHLRIHCIVYERSGTGDIPPLVYATDVSSNGTFLKKYNAACASSQTDRGMLMTRKHGAFLLDDMDELRISDSITLIYHDIEPGPELELTVTQGSEKQRFASRYLITSRLLGKGGFGKVVVGMHQKSQRQLACKIINLKGLYQGSDIPSLRQPSDENTQPGIDSGTIKRWPSKVARCSREFRILKDLSHPNIISVYKVFLSPNTIYIFSELITGGDLFSYMERKGEPLSSVDAAVIILQILKAVEYLHDRDIVHRDLKPDNILLTYPEAGARIVLTDFGNARVLPEATSSNPSRRMFSNTGTLEYVAPEIHGMNKTMPPNSGYTKAVDMWSIGVVTANLLTGEAMFGAFRYDPDPAKAILARSAECDISVIDDPTYYAWSKVRDKPKDFVKNLLVLRIDDRMSVKEALNHPWFTNKYLAAEYEALYQRSIMDWQPQRKVYRLVEPIRMPSTDDRLVTQTRSSHFQPTSVQASLRDIKERFTGSQDWDLSVVYPPSEGDSLVLEHKEATFEGSSRYDQYSYDSGTQPGYEQSRDSIGASMDQRSLEQEPHASGMYPIDEAASASHEQDKDGNMDDEVFAQPRQTIRDPLDPPVIFGTPVPNYDSLTYSPVSYPPLTQESPQTISEPRAPSPDAESSIVYETPVRDSQLQELPCYRDVFGAEVPDEHNDHVHAHKRRKLTQAYA